MTTTVLTTQKITPDLFGSREDTLLVWLGMAGVMANARGTVLLIDPLLRVLKGEDGQAVSETYHRFRVPLPIEAHEVPRVDAVLYTHEDGDHFALPTARTLERNCRPTFYAPPPVAKMLIAEAAVAPQRVHAIHDWERFRIGQAQVTVTPALHDYPRPPRPPIARGEAVGFRIQTPDGVIWNPGDTKLIPELEQVRGVDVLMFDVAEVDAHLGPAGSAHLARTSGAKLMVAYHYGTYDMPPGSWGGCDPQDALPHVKDLAAKFLIVNPGERLRLPAT